VERRLTRAAAEAAWLAAHRAHQRTSLPHASPAELQVAIDDWREANRKWKQALEDWHRMLVEEGEDEEE